MKKFIVRTISILSVFLMVSNIKNVHALSSDQKVITTSLTNSNKYSFPDTIPYEDDQGFSGIYQKDGEPYVISGSDATSKVATSQQSSSTNKFPQSIFYNDGTFTGFLDFTRADKISKNINGTASIQEGYNQTCLKVGRKVQNFEYDSSKFNYYDMTTWKFWETGSIWSSPFVAGVGNSNSSSGFTVNWSGNRATSAYYNNGGFNGAVSINGPNIISPPFGDIYKSNPNNGYTLPQLNQQVNVGTKTYNYLLNGLVYGTSYIGYYSGTVFKPDNRVWKQNYKGIAENLQVKANIERVLSPHEPNFKGGEKGILKITITGKAQKLKITFPRELSALDNTLNKEITLNGQSVETINYEFFVPLEAQSKDYNVEVKVFKDTREKSSYPSFKVNGDITSNLRTRIR